MSEVLNMEVVDELLSLCGNGDPDLLLDLMGAFLDDAPRRVRVIEESLASGDLDALSKAARCLEGSASSLGMQVLRRDCVTLQAACSENAVKALQHHFGEAIVALQAMREQYR